MTINKYRYLSRDQCKYSTLHAPDVMSYYVNRNGAFHSSTATKQSISKCQPFFCDGTIKYYSVRIEKQTRHRLRNIIKLNYLLTQSVSQSRVFIIKCYSQVCAVNYIKLSYS